MLTRLMFGGGTAQVLVMQAGHKGDDYGYNRFSNYIYGELTPNYIMYQGEKYEILSVYTYTRFGKTYFSFNNNKMPKGQKMIIEINGTVYTFIRDEGITNKRFIIETSIFTSTSTYIIKILSIK